MDSASVTAIAALAGSVIGGLTSLTATWISQSVQARTQQLVSDKARRQELYKMFIDEASNLYADALASDQAEVSKMIGLYAMTSRIRVLSSQDVVESAEKVIHVIVETYFQPNKTLDDLRGALLGHKLDLLRSFSEACREEIFSIGRHPRSWRSQFGAARSR